MTRPPKATGRPAPAVIGCTIRVTDDGAVTVRRDQGCTLANVRELCEALVRGELEVIDLTAARTPLR